MKRNVKKQVTMAGLLLLMVVSLVGTALAFPGHGKTKNAALKDALEAGDYDAFKEALAETERGQRMAERLTEARFDQMVERYQAMLERKAAIDEAIDAEDYEAWLDAIKETKRGAKLAEVITEDQFDTIIAIHEAHEAEDYETARALKEELRDELGLEKPQQHPKFGKGRF